MEKAFYAIIVCMGLAALFGLPLMITGFHTALLFGSRYGDRIRKLRNVSECLTWFLGPLYSIGYLAIMEVGLKADWEVQLANHQIHTPLASFAWPTVLTLACVGLAGYFLLRLVPLRYMPPLVVVTGLACSYGGLLVCVLWMVQVSGLAFFWLLLFPLNWILLVLIQMKNLMIQWKQLVEEERKSFRNPFLQKISGRLQNALTWPVAALVLFLPIFGGLIGILVLFGQQPDDVIRGFTETSDWNLSQRVSPQNIFYDEHYLCTVAAGGHRKVVKPLRMGMRHGHPVIVNRQLCIANAFEQVLEERMPRFHHGVRSFYDKYGFPIAKCIRSPYIADLIYIFMKPLEWLFLAVLYFCDVKPENRIAVQYLQKKQEKGTETA